MVNCEDSMYIIAIYCICVPAINYTSLLSHLRLCNRIVDKGKEGNWTRTVETIGGAIVCAKFTGDVQWWSARKKGDLRQE